jgi:hypothetical protein
MTSEEKFAKWRQRLQPGRNGLLINGEWGMPLADLSKAEAAERGLAAWNHRWVAASELELLKPQYRAYRRIRSIAAIIAGIGLYVLTQAPDKIGTVHWDVRGLVAAGSVLLYPFFHFAVAWGIAEYKNAARWTAVLLYPLLIPPRTFYATQTSEIGSWYMIVLAFFVYVLVGFFSKNARMIFATGSKKRAAAESGKERP